VTVTLYNATAIQWVQVWIGNADLETLHLEWHELAVVATCANTTCTLPINLNLPAGDYVSYIQPWGEQVGFVQNDLEGWLGPVTFAVASTARTPIPTMTPRPTRMPQTDLPIAGASAMNSVIAELFIVNSAQQLTDAFNATSTTNKVIYVLPGAIYELQDTLSVGQPTNNGVIAENIYVIGGGTVSPISFDANTLSNPTNTVAITKSASALNQNLFFVNNGSLTLYNIEIRGDATPSTYDGELITNHGNLTLIETRVDNANSSYSSFGGGIYSAGPNNLSIMNSLFTRNNAFSEGGAILNKFESNATIDCSTFESNSVNSSVNYSVGAAIANITGGYNLLRSQVAVTRSNFITNSSQGKTLYNDVVYNNTAAHFTLDDVYIDDTVPANIGVTNPRTQPVDITNCGETPDFLPEIDCPADTSGLPQIITDKCASGTSSTPSPEELATEFPLPMTATQPVILSDLDYVDRAWATNATATMSAAVAAGTPQAAVPTYSSIPLCSRDINAENGGSDNYPLIASIDSEVWVTDTTNDAFGNQNLGNFVVLRVPLNTLFAEVPELETILVNNLSQQAGSYITNRAGAIYIGYAHLANINSPAIGTVVPAETSFGMSGNSGLGNVTDNKHLDLSVYYVSETGRLREPSAGMFGVPTSYLDYFSVYRSDRVDNRFGLIELIDPLLLWPILETSFNSASIDRQCP